MGAVVGLLAYIASFMLVLVGAVPLYKQVVLYLDSGIWFKLPALYLFDYSPIKIPWELSNNLTHLPWEWIRHPDSWLGAHVLLMNILNSLHYSVIPLTLALILAIIGKSGIDSF